MKLSHVNLSHLCGLLQILTTYHQFITDRTMLLGTRIHNDPNDSKCLFESETSYRLVSSETSYRLVSFRCIDAILTPSSQCSYLWLYPGLYSWLLIVSMPFTISSNLSRASARRFCMGKATATDLTCQFKKNRVEMMTLYLPFPLDESVEMSSSSH